MEGKSGKALDSGLDLEGTEPVENWERRFLETCDIGRESVERRVEGVGVGVVVVSGGSADGLALGAGEESLAEELEQVEVGVIAAVVVMPSRMRAGGRAP